MFKLLAFLVFLFISSQYSNANTDTISKMYSCIANHGNTKTFTIANKTLLVPQYDMPALLSGFDNEECKIYKGKRHINGIILNNNSINFLNRVVKAITQVYKKSCDDKICNKVLDCKVYLYSIMKVLNRNMDEDLSNYTHLSETEMIFLNVIDNDPMCTKKIKSFYTSKRLLFYKKSSCVGILPSKQDNYVEMIIKNKGHKWHANLINCFNNINDTSSDA